ncbi:MAG: ribonuclease R [Fusobacterium sp.]|uniref:ribonuclease R n=1 Tax=Fusobacterium sp. TaxID=68766 RepID=UPI0026DB1078|nr:ribonuclease R [Fusobacterium sp.]MDO4690357.1 ribonuclease R [Fusobacterium sp.]
MNLEKDLEKLKEVLKKKNYLSFDEATKVLEWSTKNKKSNKAIIMSWVDDGELSIVKSGKITLPEQVGFLKGTFSIVKDRFAFVDIEKKGEEKEGIFIPKSAFNNALDGDTVLVRITKEKNEDKGAEGEVAKIISHEKKVIIGILQKNKTFSFVVPTRSIGKDIYIPNELTMGAENEDLVAVEITFWGDDSRKPEGKVIKILGSISNTKNMIDALIFREGLKTEFSTEAMLEVKEMIENSVKEKWEGNRKDLTKLPIITIDGEDAKDLDDAVYVEKLENGNFRLIVAIADVSHYVKFNSKLDLEARERGNSVYLVDRVLPMFPKEISNGICSLNERENKMTFSCEAEIDANGNVVSADIYKSVINSVHRMTYTDVNKILDGNEELSKKYSDIKDMLLEMQELSKILRSKKYKRGSIDFELPEIKVTLNDDGTVAAIGQRERGEGEKIIEDFMIVANEVVAERIFWLDIPSVYRTHEKPTRESIASLNETLAKFGYKIPNLDNIHPKQFQEIIENSRKREINMLVHKMILMALKQARYTVENIGHFGLASKFYTHFTSPIRRYSDLMVHRILNNIISEKAKKNFIYEDELMEICSHISKTERVAMKAEEESIRIKLVEYMSDKVGEVFEAVVSGFSQRKVFFETAENIECSWDVTTAEHYYEFDEINYVMVDRDNKEKVYSLGDKVKVILQKTDFYTLEISVSPIELLEDK